MIAKVQKRDGKVVDFNKSKIADAVYKAITSTGQGDGVISKKVSDRVFDILNIRFKDDEIPKVEQIQDIVEEVLILENLVETAKAYILYREQRRRIREAKEIVDESTEKVDRYISELDWKVYENANMTFSLQGLNQYIIADVSKKYWLNKIYPKEIREAANSEAMHIHDLDGINTYCCGWDLYDLLRKGFRGVPGKLECKPPKHLRTALGQLVNFLYTLQGESSGAQAVSNFDTLLAPFIRYDNLDYPAVKQAMQEFLYNCMVPTRVGFQTPFINVSLDINPSAALAKLPVVIGGKSRKETYAEFQSEMDMLVRAFYECMMEGDSRGRPFTFPIPTVSITKDFDWDNPNLDGMWEASAKYGINYFSNFIQSDMDPADVRSMCCRLRLDNKELHKRGGGLFGSAPLTGCYDDKTEILTINGWKLFDKLNLEDDLFTLSDNNRIEVNKPGKLFKYDYSGQMYHFKTKSLDLMVTPNHRMVVDNRRKDYAREFVEAQDFNINNHNIPKQGKWYGVNQSFFILPSVYLFKGTGPVSRFSVEEMAVIKERVEGGDTYFKIANDYNVSLGTIHKIFKNPRYGLHENFRYKVEPIKIKMDDWLAFFGFWLAEGCTDNEKIASSHGYRTVITQVKNETREEIKKVLNGLPFNYSEEKNNLVICNKQLWSYLRQFGNKYNKFIPQDIKKLSKRQIKILFDWMVKGDGHVRKTNGQINYWTTSKRLADDLQEIIMKIGFLGTSTPQKKKEAFFKGRKIKSSTIYNIGVQIAKRYRLRDESIKQIHYVGKVYCCEVKNHSVFVRRNGKVSWCGNSIGVVTINLPRIGYLAKTRKEYFDRLERMMELAKESLEIKRKTLNNFMEKGLYPYTRYYLDGIGQVRGSHLGNHFSTIGLLGMNESLLNFIGEDIASDRGRKFAGEILDFMREKLVKYQEDTGNLYNLEASPAEGASFKQAKADKKLYPDIIVAGANDKPYYTNSSQLPVNYTDDVFEALELQDQLQTKYTGGCIEKGNKVLTDKGLIEIEKIVKEFPKLKPIKALSYNQKKNKSEWDEITDAIKIDVKKHNKINIKAERGLDITTSDWHPFFVLDRSVPKNICPICRAKIKNIKGFANHIRNSGNCKEKYEQYSKYKVIEKRADEIKEGDYILQNSENVYEDKKTEIDENLMWLIGFYIGDGCISSFKDNGGGNNLKKHKLRFFSEHQEPLDKIVNILYDYFDSGANVISNDKRSKTLKEVGTSRQSVIDFFVKSGFQSGQKTYNVSVPEPVKNNLSRSNVFALLSGLMDSDGHIDRQGDFEYYTVSDNLADDILEIMTRAGLLIGKIKKPTKRKNESDLWRLRIPGHELTRIKDNLSNTVNVKKINKVLSNRKKRRLPVVRVEKVSKTDVKDNQFYDLTTKNNHNYLAGKNSLVFIHNTVLHIFLGEKLDDGDSAKVLVKKIFSKYHLPYITLTPTFSVCPVHGYQTGEHQKCSRCIIEKPKEVYTKV